MSQRGKVRRLSDEEGRQLQRIVRRGGGKSEVNVVRYRRAMVVLASAGGNTVEVIARLVQTSPDRVREMIHRFVGRVQDLVGRSGPKLVDHSLQRVPGDDRKVATGRLHRCHQIGSTSCRSTTPEAPASMDLTTSLPSGWLTSSSTAHADRAVDTDCTVRRAVRSTERGPRPARTRRSPTRPRA